MENIRILIIGAGMAGLSAASHLYQNGFRNLTILEAQHRIGGRIHTLSYGKASTDLVELGANWIHGGALNNPIITLANEAGLLNEWILLDRTDGFCYTSDGKAISKELFDSIWNKLLQWEEEIAVHQPDILASSRISLQDFFKQKLKLSLKEYPDYEHNNIKCIFNCLLNYEGFHQGTSLSEIPIPDIAGTDCGIPGGNIKVEDGLCYLIKHLENALPNGCIKLGTEVTQISFMDNTGLVRCRNGQLYHADHIILTIPLGTLKHCHENMFLPALPQYKIDAMNSLDFGKVNKIFLKWDVPFWREGNGGIKIGWSDEELLNGKEWYKKIFGFDEVLNNRHVLVAWISGEEAEYMETLSDADIIDGCMILLQTFLNNPSIPKPVSVIHSSWCTNPYSMGVYSNVTFDTTQHTFTDLASPVHFMNGKPKLLFAGEATSQFGYSTMHGARSSGLREAQRILDCYNKKTKSKI